MEIYKNYRTANFTLYQNGESLEIFLNFRCIRLCVLHLKFLLKSESILKWMEVNLVLNYLNQMFFWLNEATFFPLLRKYKLCISIRWEGLFFEQKFEARAIVLKKKDLKWWQFLGFFSFFVLLNSNFQLSDFSFRKECWQSWHWSSRDAASES